MRNPLLGTPSSSEAATPAGSHAVSGESSGPSTDARSLLDTAATVVPSMAEDASPAPCGTICLALLLQRCSDKSAAVRAKALGNLSAAVRDMLDAQKSSDSAHMLHCRQVGTCFKILLLVSAHADAKSVLHNGMPRKLRSVRREPYLSLILNFFAPLT